MYFGVELRKTTEWFRYCVTNKRDCNNHTCLEFPLKDKNFMLHFNLQVSPLEGNDYSKWIIQ